MAYCTQADVQDAAGGSERLKEISDLENSGSIDSAVVTKAIAVADELIDSYAQRRHAVPFSPVPVRIRELSVNEAVYWLKKRRQRVLSDDEREDHSERIIWLENLAKGLVSPGVDPIPAKSTSVAGQIIDRSTDEDISRDALKGF